MVRLLTREEVREQIRQITTPGTAEFQKWQSGDKATSECLIDLHKILTPGQSRSINANRKEIRMDKDKEMVQEGLAFFNAGFQACQQALNALEIRNSLVSSNSHLSTENARLQVSNDNLKVDEARKRKTLAALVSEIETRQAKLTEFESKHGKHLRLEELDKKVADLDCQAEQNSAAENEHVAEVKAELLPAIERAKAKRPGLKDAWSARNQLVNEINAHRYPNGFPQSAARYLADLPKFDPVALLDRVLAEYENTIIGK